MTDLSDVLAAYRCRMAELLVHLERHGRICAKSRRDPSYAILLTRNTDGSALYRVTSFRDGEPVGHREYNRLEGGAPVQNALAEFIGDDWQFDVTSSTTPLDEAG